MAGPTHTQPTETEFLQTIESASVNIPNCKVLHKSVIKSGPRTYKLAAILEFTNENGVVTHRELRLNSYPYRVESGLNVSLEQRLARWTCRDEEIERLRAFLEAVKGVDAVGSHTIVPTEKALAFQEFVAKLGNADLSVPQLMDLIQALAEHAHDLRNLPQLGEDNKLRMVAAAIRVAHRSSALGKLHGLIEKQAVEVEFQQLLDQNWWMLGNHYVERIERRHWTTEETIDIMLRTADSYFDIVELKRSNVPLFKRDRGKWVVTADVSDAVNQAAHYISEIERERSVLFHRYNVDFYKLKAKVLIGYLADDEEEVEHKRAARRMYNSHLHRIEVITYDELARIAENVISANAGESGQEDGEAADPTSL